MKKLLYISAFAFLIFVIPSCNKKLDVKPQNNATPDQIKTSDDVTALLFGAYAQLQNYGGFGEQYILVSDLIASAEQVKWVGSYVQYRDIQNKRMTATNYIMASLWGNSYKTLNIVNTVLDKINLVDSSIRPTVQAEAKFIRATVYYEMLGVFAKPYSDGKAATNPGVPLVLAPIYTYDPATNNPSRATVQQVYTQIIADLVAAIVDLPETNDDFRADRYSAKAFLSRAYLNTQDYTNAAIQANDVIESGNFRLTNTYAQAFNNTTNSSEDIFAIQQTAQSNPGTSNDGLITFYAPYGGKQKGRGDAQIDPDYFNYFETTDDRGNFVTQSFSIGSTPGYYPNKWSTFYKALSVVRLSEMYLTRGEANLFNNTHLGAEPADDINIIRGRSNASPLAAGSLTAQDFVDERFRELGFEGDRMWTLKRLKMDVDGFGYDDDALILPLPQSEIDVNHNLKQNTGY